MTSSMDKTARASGQPRNPSEEATREQLDMARHQGDTFGDALDLMITEVADIGEEKLAGPYLVGYAIEEAEGIYEPDETGELVWVEPNDENVHTKLVCGKERQLFDGGAD